MARAHGRLHSAKPLSEHAARDREAHPSVEAETRRTRSRTSHGANARVSTLAHRDPSPPCDELHPERGAGEETLHGARGALSTTPQRSATATLPDSRTSPSGIGFSDVRKRQPVEREGIGDRVKMPDARNNVVLARLRLSPTRHARRPFLARACRAPSTRRSLVPSRRKPLSETWLNCEDRHGSRSPVLCPFVPNSVISAWISLPRTPVVTPATCKHVEVCHERLS